MDNLARARRQRRASYFGLLGVLSDEHFLCSQHRSASSASISGGRLGTCHPRVDGENKFTPDIRDSVAYSSGSCHFIMPQTAQSVVCEAFAGYGYALIAQRLFCLGLPAGRCAIRSAPPASESTSRAQPGCVTLRGIRSHRFGQPAWLPVLCPRYTVRQREACLVNTLLECSKSAQRSESAGLVLQRLQRSRSQPPLTDRPPCRGMKRRMLRTVVVRRELSFYLVIINRLEGSGGE